MVQKGVAEGVDEGVDDREDPCQPQQPLRFLAHPERTKKQWEQEEQEDEADVDRRNDETLCSELIYHGANPIL